jgi:hypothetical protein
VAVAISMPWQQAAVKDQASAARTAPLVAFGGEYDMAWKTYPGAQEVWSKYLTEPDGLNWLVSFGSNHNKPLSFPEWGLGTTTSPAGSGNVSGGDDAYFVNQVASFITDHNFIEAGLWDYKGQFPNSSENPNATAALINDFK